MSDDWYDEYEPVSGWPADGWRAVYIHEPDADGNPGWSADPLIGWAVCRISQRRIGYSDSTHEGGAVCGFVSAGSYTERAGEAQNFWFYLPPGQPDPTPEEVVAELAKREKTRELLAGNGQRPAVSVPAVVTRAEFGPTDDGTCGRWRVHLVPDGWNAETSADIILDPADPEATGKMFKRLGYLGVGVPDPFNPAKTINGDAPFWVGPDGQPYPPDGTAERLAAEAMSGRRVLIQQDGQGRWQVSGQVSAEMVSGSGED
jgi:hypothetical protein